MNWKTGLDYGWWKSLDLWVGVFLVMALAAYGTAVLSGWFW